MKNRFISALILGLLVIVTGLDAPFAVAQSIPTFPLCSNPQGSLKVQYSEGTHGIVGSTETYTGSDAVYTLSDTTLTQCFCPDEGGGIQTNWWKADGLSETEINSLRRDGWNYVPNGSLWGLDSSPYVTKNTDYDCHGTGGTSVQSQVLSAIDVLGLANTGDMTMFVGTGAGVLAFALLGLYLLKNSKIK